MTYAPTGGIVAAVTTIASGALGRREELGIAPLLLAARRDGYASGVDTQLGYYDEAVAWRDWFVRAVAGSPRQIQIMYGVGGERWLPEWIVSWLPGV